jgi:hypothetical protein
VAISDPATAHFTAHKNLGNTRIAYKPIFNSSILFALETPDDG